MNFRISIFLRRLVTMIPAIAGDRVGTRSAEDAGAQPGRSQFLPAVRDDSAADAYAPEGLDGDCTRTGRSPTIWRCLPRRDSRHECLAAVRNRHWEILNHLCENSRDAVSNPCAEPATMSCMRHPRRSGKNPKRTYHCRADLLIVALGCCRLGVSRRQRLDRRESEPKICRIPFLPTPAQLDAGNDDLHEPLRGVATGQMATAKGKRRTNFPSRRANFTRRAARWTH